MTILLISFRFVKFCCVWCLVFISDRKAMYLFSVCISDSKQWSTQPPYAPNRYFVTITMSCYVRLWRARWKRAEILCDLWSCIMSYMNIPVRMYILWCSVRWNEWEGIQQDNNNNNQQQTATEPKHIQRFIRRTQNVFNTKLWTADIQISSIHTADCANHAKIAIPT